MGEFAVTQPPLAAEFDRSIVREKGVWMVCHSLGYGGGTISALQRTPSIVMGTAHGLALQESCKRQWQSPLLPVALKSQLDGLLLVAGRVSSRAQAFESVLV